MAKMTMNVLVFACCAMISSAAFAQGVPPLEKALQDADPDRVSEMQDGLKDTSLSEAGSGIDVQSVVLSGLDDGHFTASERSDLQEALEIINANSDYFSFDIAAVMNAAIERGDLTTADAAETMRLFALLSPEAKAIIGANPEFNDSDPSWPASFTPADQAIICNTPHFSCN